jgi:hypothetical protein
MRVLQLRDPTLEFVPLAPGSIYLVPVSYKAVDEVFTDLGEWLIDDSENYDGDLGEGYLRMLDELGEHIFDRVRKEI